MLVKVDDLDAVPVPDVGDGVWVPLSTVVAGGFSEADLGDGRLGLCPAPDRCVPVPADARITWGGEDLVRVDRLADALGLVVAADDARAAVLRADPADAATAPAGERVDLALPSLKDGRPVRLAEDGRRTCVFAWASW